MIRKYRDSDLETLRQITAVCFEHVSIDKNIEDKFGVIAGVDWKERKKAHINHDVNRNADGVFVAEVDGEIAGYVTTDVNPKSKIGDIPNFAGEPRFQGRGIGRQLLESALAHLMGDRSSGANTHRQHQNHNDYNLGEPADHADPNGATCALVVECLADRDHHGNQHPDVYCKHDQAPEQWDQAQHSQQTRRGREGIVRGNWLESARCAL